MENLEDLIVARLTAQKLRLHKLNVDLDNEENLVVKNTIEQLRDTVEEDVEFLEMVWDEIRDIPFPEEYD